MPLAQEARLGGMHAPSPGGLSWKQGPSQAPSKMGLPSRALLAHKHIGRRWEPSSIWACTGAWACPSHASSPSSAGWERWACGRAWHARHPCSLSTCHTLSSGPHVGVASLQAGMHSVPLQFGPWLDCAFGQAGLQPWAMPARAPLLLPGRSPQAPARAADPAAFPVLSLHPFNPT